MSKAKTSTKSDTKGESVTKKAPAPKKLETGWALPQDIVIMGRTSGYLEGEPGWDVELWDAHRIAQSPATEFVTSLIEHGLPKPILCIKRDGKLIAWDGRQRTMGVELANVQIHAADPKAPLMLVPYVVTEKANALDVTRANEFALIDSPMVKALRAMHLKSLGYKENDIIKAFSSDGATPISKMTLTNWKRAANCCSRIRTGFENGDYPITICYEIGKIDHDSEPEKERLQVEALATILENGGTLKGKAGRKNASEAADADEGEGSGEESGPRARGAGLSKPAIRELATRFEADEDEPFTDLDKHGEGREYCDGDFQLLTSHLLAAIVGDDPTGDGLKGFPSIYRHVKKYLRSETVN